MRTRYLGSLVSGISLSSGILSLRNWLKRCLVNPIFSSSFSSSVCGSKLFFHSCVGLAFCSTWCLWTLLFDVLILLYAKNESKLQESAKHNNWTHLLREHLAILIPLEAHAVIYYTSIRERDYYMLFAKYVNEVKLKLSVKTIF